MSVATIEHDARVHATLSSIGFVVLLPIGIIVPRYARTFTNKWFYGHAFFQFIVSGPVIIVGFAMGYKAVSNTITAGSIPHHFFDQHTHLGLVLFILYFLQLTLGLFAHLVKVPSHRFLLHRSPQQILHIMVGLAIVGLSLFQVHLGYTYEWQFFIGTIPPSSVNQGWKAVVIIIPVLYVLGYALYPRQLSQEAAMREEHRNGYDLRTKEVSA